MNICKRCVWGKHQKPNLIFCMFPKCIMKVKVIEGAKKTKDTVQTPKLPELNTR